jgi:hypothetical protein
MKVGRRQAFWVLAMLLSSMILIFSSMTATAQTDNSLVGKWGYITLQHNFPNDWCTWKTEAGTVTFNSDGSAVTTYAESADNCPDEHYCKPTDTDSHTYTINTDGTFTFYTREDHANGVLSDDGKMLMMNGTSVGSQALVVGVRLDTTKQYNNSDLSGDYYSIGYERDNLDGVKGYNRAWSTIISMDGAGNYLMNGNLNGDGSIITVTNDSGIYSVHSDGSITINDGITGYASGDAKVSVMSNPIKFYPQTGDDFAANFAMKKQDRNYSTSDLSGKWAYTAFGDTSGSVRSEFGTITCDSSGACQLLAKVLNADGQITNKQKSLSISIEPDGSYNGFLLSGATPHTSGALGNDGNTVFLVMNEDTTSTNDRLIGVGIRISVANVTLFSDVPSGYWAEDYVTAIYDAGITIGCAQDDPYTLENERRYCPEDSVTRGQMAAFIIRAKYGENFSYTTTPYFTDVPSTHTFFKYVQKLKDVGITAVSGIYEVDSFVTRGQMAAFIIRAKYGENFSYTTTPYFSDVPSTHNFFKYVQKLRDEGITSLTGTYYVDNNVTRAEMAAFIARAFLGMQ